jgi:multidrug resistance efflux pump
MAFSDSEVPRGADGAAREQGAPIAFLDRALWQNFAEAKTEDDFYQRWLALQCSMVERVIEGVVYVQSADDQEFLPVAVWPEASDAGQRLFRVADVALGRRHGIVQALIEKDDSGAERPKCVVAYPIQIDGVLVGVVALGLAPRSEIGLQAVLRQLQWGAGWLEVLFRRRQIEEDEEDNRNLLTAFEVTAAALDLEAFRPAAISAVTELATQLRCDRVSLGFVRRGRCHVVAMSHTAHFGKRMNLVRRIGEAMDEAIDQRAAVFFPGFPEQPPQVTYFHERLATEFGVGAAITVPLQDAGGIYGALTFERPPDDPFQPATVDLCEAAAAMVGPVLDLKRREDRWIVTKNAIAVGNLAKKIVGPRHFALKLALIAVVAVVGFFSVATGDFRVTADAVLEGKVRRVISAPFDGYIAAAFVRAGDTVKAGDVICELDDTELRLTQQGWSSQKRQLNLDLADARASHDRSKINITEALIQQADAELKLISDRLSRTRVLAPFDGVIIEGDLSQSLGAAVRHGEAMYQMAPLGDYRLILQVDERDIGDIAVGQHGLLTLTSIPESALAFSVQKSTPVSVAKEGRNYFRVEATLDETPSGLRPGMDGVGKVVVGDRMLIWIWTYKIVDWLRLWLWRWLP